MPTKLHQVTVLVFILIIVMAPVSFYTNTAIVAKAQVGTTDVVISPARLNLNLQPGMTSDHSFTLNNYASQPIEVTISTSSPNWVSLTPSSATIPARQATTFALKLAVPADAEAKSYQISLFFNINPNSQNLDQNLQLASRLASTILINVRKTADENSANNIGNQTDSASSLVIVEAKLTSPWWWPNRTTLELTVSNRGRWHGIVHGLVKLIKSNGTTIAEARLNENAAIIMPDQTQTYTVNMPRPVWLSGHYQVESTLALDEEPTITDTQNIWLWPWALVILLVAGLGAMLGALKKK